MRHDVGIVEVPKCPESRSAAASVYALLESVFNLDEVPLHRTGLAQPNGQAAKQGDPLCVCVCATGTAAASSTATASRTSRGENNASKRTR